MATKTNKMANVPNLRFPGFEGEWKKDKVGRLCDFIVPGRNKPTIFNGNIPWITTPDIDHNQVVFASKKGLLISKEEAKKVGSKIIPEKSIILSCVGELGLVAIAGTEMVINQQLHAFIPKKIEYRFLLYCLGNQKKYMEKIATKTAVPYMNKDNCNSIPITFPSSQEQQKISSFLSLIDERIQTQNKIIEQLETLIKGLSEKLLARKLRFKDQNASDFPNWKCKKLENILKIGSGRDYKHLSTGNIPVFGTGGLMTFVDSFLFDGETVCIGRKGTIDQPMYHTGKIWTVDTLFYTHSFYESLPKFVFYLFKIINWKNYNEASGVPSLSKSTIEKIDIELPLVVEQHRIATILSAIDNKIKSESKILTNFKKQKRVLLQNLFI
jgi:type I restriction enzyme S subunit